MATSNGASAANGVNGIHHGALNILIVGAGIGGLTAALALRQQGHQVTVRRFAGITVNWSLTGIIAFRAIAVCERIGRRYSSCAKWKWRSTEVGIVRRGIWGEQDGEGIESSTCSNCDLETDFLCSLQSIQLRAK
jgi:glycine/D-amino acid oxidase-like deaminating enzyme